MTVVAAALTLALVEVHADRRITRGIVPTGGTGAAGKAPRRVRARDRRTGSARPLAQAMTRVLGPAPAPVTKLKNNYRYHMQLSAERFEEIRDVWRAVENSISPHKNVQFIIDVDPVNMR